MRSDKQLIEEFRRGEADAFSRLYDRYRKPILRMVRRRIKNSDITEELVQDVFLRVFRFRENYNPDYEFSTWLWTIARNIVSDYLSHSQSDPLAGKYSSGRDLELHDMVSNQEGAEALLVSFAERRRLLKMMGKLPKLQRRAILLRVIRGFSYDEIARNMELSLSAVKSLIHRGKTSLQLFSTSRVPSGLETMINSGS